MHEHQGRNRPRWEVADIFNRFWDSFRKRHKVSPHQDDIAEAILRCRTSELGGHKETCPVCDYQYEAYNSCRNRHCPKCQYRRRMEWMKDRLLELLPLPYYHVVFTMPHCLNNLVLCNKEILYEAFFAATSYALNKFSLDPKFLGAQPGFFGILHTWGQTLSYHVHIHYIVIGGGLDNQNHQFIRLPCQNEFLFPAKAMSKTVRGKFVQLLKAAFYKGQLQFPGELASLSERDAFLRFCGTVGNESWVNYVKKPFAGPEQVLNYVGRYTHRVAISNHRIKEVNDAGVTFEYKDYDDDSRIKYMTLDPEHFIQRFLWHCLPKGFRKIRYYGFMGYAVRSKKIAQIRELLQELWDETIKANQAIQAWLDQYTEFLEKRCPKCKIGFMVCEPIPINSS
jgi:hypothetical protein